LNEGAVAPVACVKAAFVAGTNELAVADRILDLSRFPDIYDLVRMASKTSSTNDTVSGIQSHSVVNMTVRWRKTNVLSENPRDSRDSWL
jgi:hypothetical protein